MICFAVHCPPQRRTISYAGDYYFLSFPDIIFYVHCLKETLNSELNYRFYYLKCAFTNESLTEYNVPYFPNMSADGQCCMPQHVFALYHENDIEKLCSEVIDHFWQSKFTRSLPDALIQYLKLSKNEKGPIDFYKEAMVKTKEDSKYLPPQVSNAYLQPIYKIKKIAWFSSTDWTPL